MRSFLIIFALFSLCLAGCETPAYRYFNGSPVAGQSFAHIEALPVNVEKIEVVNRSGAVVQPRDFMFSLPDQAITYFSQKFMPNGLGGRERGRLLVRIEEANVMKDYKPAEGGLANMLGIGGEDRYVLLIRLALEHREEDGRVLYGEVISAERRFYVSEHYSAAKREEAQLEAIETLFKALDPKISQIVRAQMRI